MYVCLYVCIAGLLNLFWGVLVFKKKAEKALEASGIPYVIVRPGGMERPTDSYKRTHNVRLATRDKLFGGQVSRLQVAELIAASVTYPDAAQNKVRLGSAPPVHLNPEIWDVSHCAWLLEVSSLEARCQGCRSLS